MLLQQSSPRFWIWRGELGSRGTPEERKVEAALAAEFMGAQARENLGLPDGGIEDTQNRMLIAGTIRRYRPKIVVAPLWEDRHPDHAAAGQTIRNSALYCALTKIDDPNPPHRVEAFFYYPLHKAAQAAFVVDTSDVFEHKLQASTASLAIRQNGRGFGVLPQGLGTIYSALRRATGTMVRSLACVLGRH